MKRIIGTLAASLLCVSAWAQPTVDPLTGHAYVVVSAPGVNWLTDEQAALTQSFNGMEGHLATITSAEEDAFVGNLVAAFGDGEFFVGGYQNPANEQVADVGWTWVNGEGTFPGDNGATGFDNPYSNWNGGEPNDAGGPGAEQFLGLNRGNIGGFNDEGNLGLIKGYVIEFDPNTDPTGGLAPGYVPDAGSTGALLGGALTLLGFASRRLRK